MVGNQEWRGAGNFLFFFLKYLSCLVTYLVVFSFFYFSLFYLELVGKEVDKIYSREQAPLTFISLSHLLFCSCRALK